MSAVIDTPAKRLLDWQKGAPKGPMKITLFPTNICNIECKHCWQRWADYDKTYKSEMSDERLLQLVDEAAELGVREWYFVGGGDAMGRGKLVIAMCRKIREHGANGAIHTNGTLFKPWMLDTLIDIGWGRILVSLDGPDTEINDYIRSRGFKKATDNMRLLTEKKRERGATTPTLAMYSTLTNLTFDKIDRFVDLAHELNCDGGLFISGLIVEGPDSAQFELTPEQKAAVPDNVRAAMAKADALGLKHNFHDYLDEHLIEDGMNMHRDYVYRGVNGLSGAMCFEPWLSMSILPDGRVGPCCAFYSEGALSLKTMSLRDVWLGKYMSDVRAGMLNGHPPDYCRRCPSNLFVMKERARVTYGRFLDESAQWDALSGPKKAVRLAGKALHSLKAHGVRRALTRGLEWARLHSG